MSTAEAEYYATCEVCKQVVYLRGLLSDMGFRQDEATTIYNDNAASVAMCKHDAFHARTKHIDVQYQFVRQEVKKQSVCVMYCPTHWMLADLMTKPVTGLTVKRLLPQVIGVWNVEYVKSAEWRHVRPGWVCV